MESLSLVIDADACDRCGKCVKDCPNTVLTRQKDAPPDVYPGRDSMCMGCQHCLAVCPTGALSILGFKPSPGEVFPEGRLPSPENMRALVRTRRSVRRYKRENVSKELLDSILDDLQYAPTGRNDRFLEYLVVDDVEAMDALREKLIAIMEGALGDGLNSPFVKAMVKYYRRDKTDMVFRGAPHLLVVSAGPGQGTPAQDVAIALSYFELLAVAAGLGTCWCGFLRRLGNEMPAIPQALGLPEGSEYYGLFFGYPAVDYHRSVHREGTSPVRRLGMI